MPKNTKAKGSRNEWRSIKLLTASGYRCLRSAASLGAFDLIGVSQKDIVLVQVKTGRWPGSAEMKEIAEFPVPPNGKKLVHRWMPYQRVPEVKEVA